MRYLHSNNLLGMRSDHPREINRIKVVLVQCKVSQKELAIMLGVHRTTVSKICSNKLQPSLSKLVKIALYLQVDIRRLLNPTPDIYKTDEKV